MVFVRSFCFYEMRFIYELVGALWELNCPVSIASDTDGVRDTLGQILQTWHQWRVHYCLITAHTNPRVLLRVLFQGPEVVEMEAEGMHLVSRKY